MATVFSAESVSTRRFVLLAGLLALLTILLAVVGRLGARVLAHGASPVQNVTGVAFVLIVLVAFTAATVNGFRGGSLSVSVGLGLSPVVGVGLWVLIQVALDFAVQADAPAMPIFLNFGAIAAAGGVLAWALGVAMSRLLA